MAGRAHRVIELDQMKIDRGDRQSGSALPWSRSTLQDRTRTNLAVGPGRPAHPGGVLGPDAGGREM